MSEAAPAYRDHYRRNGSPKRTYHCREDAKHAAKRMRRRQPGRDRLFRVYVCSVCGKYHVGGQARREES